MREALVHAGFQLRTLFELSSFEAAIRLAQQGQGIAVLPKQNIGTQKSSRLRRVQIHA
mgnify:CR=1 FL=1